MKLEMLVDGVHQYTMHLYQAMLDSGFSEGRARSEAAIVLLKEARYFVADATLPMSNKAIEIIEKVINRPLTEEEKFRLMENI